MSSLRNNYGKITDSELTFLIRRFTIDGLEDGDFNANVDGSITPVDFWVAPPPGFQFVVSQAAIDISDAGTRVLEGYGSIVTPLTNGMQFFVERGGVRTNVGLPLMSNSGVASFFPDFVIDDFQATLELRLYAFDALTHSKSPIVLNGETNDKFGVTVRDDLTTLSAHSFSIKGNIRLTVVPQTIS